MHFICKHLLNKALHSSENIRMHKKERLMQGNFGHKPVINKRNTSQVQSIGEISRSMGRNIHGPPMAKVA